MTMMQHHTDRLSRVSVTTIVAVLATWQQSQTVVADNVYSRLMIHVPKSLYQEGGYEHREALFGMPPYGGSIVQNVYYADSTLCGDNTDSTTGYPRRDMGKDGKMLPWKSPFILMVDRGNCTFVQKVRHAQRAGAAGVLIADNICQCSDEECNNEQFENMACERKEPIMADDGSGGDVSIPSFLLAKHDADRIKKVLMADTTVQVEMAWNLPNPDDRVEYDLWTTPADPVSVSFLKDFKKYAIALESHAYFTPHTYVIDGASVNCRAQYEDTQAYCNSLCTNAGRYCALDPDDNVNAGVSGNDVVAESLRRLCIWDTYGSADGIGREWWDYVVAFNDRCRNTEFFNDPKCIEDAYRAAKIDKGKVDLCMEVSGSLKADKDNGMLSNELTQQEQRGIIVIPTAFVNNAAIRGALKAENVFTAICAGFSSGTTPPICQKCASCGDAGSCVENGRCSSSSSSSSSGGGGNGVSTHTFAISLFLVVALFVGLGVWHYKRTQDDMREQVRGILAEYMPLEDQDSLFGNGSGQSGIGSGGRPLMMSHGNGAGGPAPNNMNMNMMMQSSTLQGHHPQMDFARQGSGPMDFMRGAMGGSSGGGGGPNGAAASLISS